MACNLVAAIKEMVALVSSNLFVSMPYLIAFPAAGVRLSCCA